MFKIKIGLKVTSKDNKINAYKVKQAAQNLIKEALKKSNPEYFDELYVINKYEKKPFTFNLYTPGSTYENDMLIINNFFYINLTSYDYKFLFILQSGLCHFMNSPSDEVTLQVLDVMLYQEQQETNKNSIIVKTQEPILMKNIAGKYITSKEEGYEESVDFIANATVNSLLKRNLLEKITIEPIKTKAVFCKNIINDQTLVFKGEQGLFKISGHPLDLSLFLNVGIGWRSSQGYSFIEEVI